MLAGHIHRHQILSRDLKGQPLSAPVLYPGSIERTSFAERLEEKGFLLLEFAFSPAMQKSCLSPSFVPLSCRPMVEIPLSGEQLNNPGAETMIKQILASLDPDSIIRLSIQGAVSAQAAELLQAERLRRIAPPSMNLSVNWGWRR